MRPRTTAMMAVLAPSRRRPPIRRLRNCSIRRRRSSPKPTRPSAIRTWRRTRPRWSKHGPWCNRPSACSTRADDRESALFVARLAQLLGQRRQVLPKGDLVAGLLVGQLDLPAAQRVDHLVADETFRNLWYPLAETVDVAAELAELIGKLSADVGQPLVEQRHVIAHGTCLGVCCRRPLRQEADL